MAEHQTPEQTRRRHIASMGEALGSAYNYLWNDLTWLYTKWTEYVELFGTKPSRIDLLNRAAGRFFGIVQSVVWEDCLLHIARVTDRESVGRHDNLTIRRLPDLVDDPDLRKATSDLVKAALEKTEFARDWRNRHIAHRDLSLAMEAGAKPLEPASRLKVKEALEAIAEVLNVLSQAYLDSTTMFEQRGSYRGAFVLLRLLDSGLRADKERQERLLGGEYNPDEWKSREL